MNFFKKSMLALCGFMVFSQQANDTRTLNLEDQETLPTPAQRSLIRASKNQYKKELSTLIALSRGIIRDLVDGIAITKDSKTMVTYQKESGEIVLWDLSSRGEDAIRVLTHNLVDGIQLMQHEKKLISFSMGDNSIKIWNLVANNDQPIATLAHNSVCGLRLTKDEKKLISFSTNDGVIKIWNLANNRLIRTLEHARVQDIQFFSDKFFSFSQDRTVRAWDLNAMDNNNFIEEFGHNPAERRLIDDNMIIRFGSGLIKILYKSNRSLQELIHEDVIEIKLFENKTKLISYGGYGNNSIIKIWDLTSESTDPIRQFIHEGAVSDIQLSADEKTLFSCSSNYHTTIKVWDLTSDSNEPLCTLPHPWVKKILLSPDETKLISYGSDQNKGIIIWDLSIVQKTLKRLNSIDEFKLLLGLCQAFETTIDERKNHYIHATSEQAQCYRELRRNLPAVLVGSFDRFIVSQERVDRIRGALQGQAGPSKKSRS